MRVRTLFLIVALLAVGALIGRFASTGRVSTTSTALAQGNGTPTVLPRPDFRFPGTVGRTYQDSDPAKFPQPVQAPKGAPNIVLILIDDAGFGQFSTFGGGVPSPTMDRRRPKGSATTDSTPPRCAARRAPRC